MPRIEVQGDGTKLGTKLLLDGEHVPQVGAVHIRLDVNYGKPLAIVEFHNVGLDLETQPNNEEDADEG